MNKRMNFVVRARVPNRLKLAVQKEAQRRCQNESAVVRDILAHVLLDDNGNPVPAQIKRAYRRMRDEA